MTSMTPHFTARTRGSRRRLAVRVAPLALAFALVAGCGSSDDTAGGPAPSAPGYPRTVEHAMGTTEIPGPPQRIAALDSSFVDAALALEVPVAAYTRYPASGVDVPAYLTPQDRRFLEGSRQVGTQESPDVEALYDVAPDMIVSAKVRHEQLYGQFSGVAPTVFSQTTGPTWKENIRMLARATGREGIAEQKIGAYEQRARRIGDAIRAKLGRAPSVSFVRFNAGEPTVRLYTSGSFPGIVLADAGLVRPPGQPDAQDRVALNLSQEQIRQLDADTVFVSTYSDPRTQAANARAQFESNPLWGALQGQLVDVDDTNWVTSVSLQGAATMLDDLAATYGVDPAR